MIVKPHPPSAPCWAPFSWLVLRVWFVSGRGVTALFVSDSRLPAPRVEADHVRVPREKEEIHTCSWPGPRPGCLLTGASEKSRWLGLGARSCFCARVLAASAATKRSWKQFWDYSVCDGLERIALAVCSSACCKLFLERQDEGFPWLFLLYLS